jgi:hypothetical protein
MPLRDRISPVRAKTIRSDTRAMTTNKTVTIKLRKNLSPKDSRYFVKDFILPVKNRCHEPELFFYIDKTLDRSLLTKRGAIFLKLLKEARNLPNSENAIMTGFVDELTCTREHTFEETSEESGETSMSREITRA